MFQSGITLSASSRRQAETFLAPVTDELVSIHRTWSRLRLIGNQRQQQHRNTAGNSGHGSHKLKA